MEWKPLYDKLIVRRRPALDNLSEHVVAADSHKKQQNIGTVVATGIGRLVAGNAQPFPLTIKVGMTVLFSAFSGSQIGDDSELVLLREDEVLAYEETEIVS